MDDLFSDLLQACLTSKRAIYQSYSGRSIWKGCRVSPHEHEKTFGVSQEEASRDIKILINVLRRIPRERRPNLEIWIYNRDPAVPYTDSLAVITIKVEDEKLPARAEIELELPRPKAIRRLERLLRMMGMLGRIKRERIEDLMKKLTEASVMEASPWIKVRKVEFLRRRNELILVVDFELEPRGHSISSQLIDLIKEARSPYEILQDILAWSGHLETTGPR